MYTFVVQHLHAIGVVRGYTQYNRKRKLTISTEFSYINILLKICLYIFF